MKEKQSLISLIGKLNRSDEAFKDYVLVIICASGTYKAELAYYFDDVINDINHERADDYDPDTSLVKKIFFDSNANEMADVFENEVNQDVIILKNVEYTSNANNVVYYRELFLMMNEIIAITLENKSVKL